MNYSAIKRLSDRYSGVPKPATPATLGSRIRELRQAREVPQKTLAAGVSRRTGQSFDVTYLSKIENDHIIPSRLLVLGLAAELRADPDELLALAGKPPQGVAELLVMSEDARRFYRAAVEAKLSDAEWGVLLEALERIRSR